jgi:hypothetical protein
LTIRSLDLLDLPTLYRLRGEAVSLDTARVLTRGNPLGAVSLLAYMNPQRHVYSAISNNDGAVLLGGVIHTNGDTFARLLYLAPASQTDHPDLAELIEILSAESAAWGAFHVLAELDENHPLFAALRRTGFSAYARQRMWDVSALGGLGAKPSWPRARSVDLPAVQSLYHQIVPPLLQPIEPAPRRASGFICNQGGPCYASTSTGMSGVVVFPLIHPDAANVPDKIRSLIECLPNRGGRPVYVCVRTYQSWLEHVLEDLGAKPGPQQAVMVKHMTRLVKDEQAVRARQPAGVTVQPTHMSRFDHKGKPQE